MKMHKRNNPTLLWIFVILWLDNKSLVVEFDAKAQKVYLR